MVPCVVPLFPLPLLSVASPLNSQLITIESDGNKPLPPGTGGGGAGVTVKVKGLIAVLVPSLTVTVICAVPVLPAAGVTVTVRFAPLPPNTIFAFGTRVVEEELPETVRLVAGVSASPIVNGIATVAW